MTCDFPQFRCTSQCLPACPRMEDCGCGEDDSEANPQVTAEATSSDSREFYVYVANRLSGHPGEYLANVHELSRVCRRLMDAGYVVVNPAGDLLEGLMSGDVLPVSAYQKRSLGLLHLVITAHRFGYRAALRVEHGMHRDGSISHGVIDEIAAAQEAGLPVVWSDEQLAALRGTEL